MRSTWTTKSGKNIELGTTVVGKTAYDHIATEFNLVIDGKKVNVTRQAVVKGQNCLEFVFVGTTTKQLLPITDEIAASIRTELDAVKNAIIAPDVTMSEYELRHERMSRRMNGENSDY